uniref:Xylulose kinase-1 n=1 Tax=Tanacetum cinerariifolium TaxID=118510 RepID=A0A6L2M849_TANCI|nr:xylulose kinase-1 [Tanacetum cinerariifolium]
MHHQLGDMSHHKKIFVTPSLTKKVFANMKREGKGFSRIITPLFETMMVKAPEKVGESSEVPTDTHHTPIVTQPSSSQPQKKQKSRRKQRKETEVPHTEPQTEESVPTTSNDPLPSESLGHQEDASKQGRMIDNIDQDVKITLVDETQGRINEEYMFEVNDLDGDEVIVDVTAVTTVEDVKVTTAATTPQISKDELTLAQTLIEIKAAKPKARGMKAKMEEEERITRDKDSEKARLFMEFLEKRRKLCTRNREIEKRNIPPTKAQQRSPMCTYLKNMDGWKPKNLKKKSFDEIQKLFDSVMKRVNTFVDMNTKIVEERSKKTQAEVTEGSSKRAGDELEQERDIRDDNNYGDYPKTSNTSPPVPPLTQQIPHTISSIKLPIKVIQNGNGPVFVTTDTNEIIKVLPPKTAKEVVAREKERKARTTLLVALPEDHLGKFHKMAYAKEMWEAIKSRFGGNDESKKMQKYLLKQQFEGFSVSTSKGLHKRLMMMYGRDGFKMAGHFARDYRAKGNQDSRRRDDRYNGNKTIDNGRRPAYQDDSKALVTIDGEDIDWSGHVEEDAQNYAMMAYSSSNLGSNNETLADESDSKPSKYASCESDSSVETSTSMPEPVENASKDKVIVDSGCSRNMTGNKARLIDYQEFKGGSVTFRGTNGRITGIQLIMLHSKELSSPKKTALGKDISNPLMAGRLPKTTLPTRLYIMHQAILDNDKVKTINDEVRIQALIDEKRCLSAKTTSWNEFSSTIASAIIYLATNQKFNFSRFMQLIIDHQLGDMSHHKDIYDNPSLTKKVFASMKRVGTGFSGLVTILFNNMLVPAANEVGLIQDNVQSLSIPTEPSTSKPHKKHKPKKQQTQAPKVPSPEPSPEHRLPSPYNDPLPGDKDSLKLKELIDLCTHLSNKVLELESKVIDIKSTYKERIKKLKCRVYKLEEENSVLKEFDSVYSKVDTAAPVVEKEKSFKQGRIIANFDEDVEINLEEAQAKPYRMDLEHLEKVLSMQDVDDEEPAKVEEVLKVVTAAKLITKVVTTAGATTTAEATKVSVPRRRRGVVIQDPRETTSTVVVHSENALIEQVKRSERLNDAVMKYQALKRKPLTEAQARKNMIIYLKNMAGYKMNYFKGMTYSEIRPFFEKHYNYNHAFLEEVNEDVTVPEKEVEVEVHKREEATPLASKITIVDYKLHLERNKPYFRIIRADERFKKIKLKNYTDDYILKTLKTMFEQPDVEANVWRDQKGRYGLAKRYPLTQFTLEQMLNIVRLEVEEESEMSLELLR